MTMPGEITLVTLSPFCWGHMSTVSANVTNSQIPAGSICLKPTPWRCYAPAADFPFSGGPRPLFRLQDHSAVSMRLRWCPVRTRGRQGRPKVAKVGSKGHFWSAWAPLFEVNVAQCCLYEKHTIYYVLTTLAGVRSPSFRQPARLRNLVVIQFAFFPSFSTAWDATRDPKAAQMGPKASQSHSKSTPKSS